MGLRAAPLFHPAERVLPAQTRMVSSRASRSLLCLEPPWSLAGDLVRGAPYMKWFCKCTKEQNTFKAILEKAWNSHGGG